MDSPHFDALTRRLGAAGTRRRALSVLVAGVVGQLSQRWEIGDVAAACKGYKRTCKKKSQCCKQDGLRCKRSRCRCKKGWRNCPGSDTDCTHVKADPDNCGACGNACPPATPCCVNGSCQELCGGSCCADCFMDFLDGVIPQPGTETCCGPGAGTFCSAKKQDTSDDVCCWPDQECVKGECCSDGKDGSVICGGTCCAAASCCNGTCCPDGQVCGMTMQGMACVSANRACDNDDDCLTGEVCHGSVCCSGDRICGDGVGGDVCCSAGAWCDDAHGGIDISCCAINTQCHSTWRGHRVRR